MAPFSKTPAFPSVKQRSLQTPAQALLNGRLATVVRFLPRWQICPRSSSEARTGTMCFLGWVCSGEVLKAL